MNFPPFFCDVPPHVIPATLETTSSTTFIICMPRNSRGRPHNAPAAFIHPCEPTVATPDWSVRFAALEWRGSLQRDLMQPIDQENRGRGSKSKIRNPRLPLGPTMVRSEYSLLSVVRRSGSAAQAKHTTKNRKMMATNATALCTRVISISNAQQCSPRLREINNPLSLSVTVLRHRVQSFRD